MDSILPTVSLWLETQSVRLTLSACFLYCCTWIFATEWKVSRIVPLHLTFWFGAIIISMSSILVSVFGQGFQSDSSLLVFGGLGAAACFVAALLHHPSTRITIVGAAILAALLHALDYNVTDEKVYMILLFVLNVFMVSYVGAHPQIIKIFGPGSTLPSILLMIAFQLVQIAFSSPSSSSSILYQRFLSTVFGTSADVTSTPTTTTLTPSSEVNEDTLTTTNAVTAAKPASPEVAFLDLCQHITLVALPFLLIKLDHVTYTTPPSSSPSSDSWAMVKRVVSYFSGFLCFFAVLDTVIMASFYWNTTAGNSGSSNNTSLYSFVAVTAVLLGYVYIRILAKPSAALGPFYHFDRRATVLLLIAIVLTTFHLAGVESASSSSSSSPSYSLVLLCTFSGYGIATLLISLSSLLLDSLGPQSASGFRAAALDYICLLGLLVGGVVVLSHHPDAVAVRRDHFLTVVTTFLTRLRVLDTLTTTWSAIQSTVLSPIPALLFPQGFTTWSSSPTHAPIATIALAVVSILVWTALARTSLVFTSLLGNVVGRASPRVRAVALTYTGDVSSAVTPKLLALLREAGRARATFFIPASGAVLTSEGATLVRSIIQDGHEVGILSSLAGPHSYDDFASEMSLAKGTLQGVFQGVDMTSIGGIAMNSSSGSGSATPARGRAGSSVATTTTTTSKATTNSNKKGGSNSNTNSISNNNNTPSTPAASSVLLSSTSSTASTGLLSATNLPPWAMPKPPAHIVPPAPGTILWCRPQDGSRDVRFVRAAVANGLGVAYWSVSPFDWDGSDATVIAQRVKDQAALDQKLGDREHTLLDPTTVNGAVINLSHSVTPSEYIASPAAANVPLIDPMSTTRATISVLSNAPGRTQPQFVTLSELCPGLNQEAEVFSAMG